MDYFLKTLNQFSQNDPKSSNDNSGQIPDRPPAKQTDLLPDLISSRILDLEM